MHLQSRFMTICRTSAYELKRARDTYRSAMNCLSHIASLWLRARPCLLGETAQRRTKRPKVIKCTACGQTEQFLHQMLQRLDPELLQEDVRVR